MLSAAVTWHLASTPASPHPSSWRYLALNSGFIIHSHNDGGSGVLAPASLEDRLTETADMTLDVQGLACPLPVLKARKALASLTAGGAVLEVLSTEPQSVADFEAFCGVSGHALLAHGLNGGTYRFLIRKGG